MRRCEDEKVRYRPPLLEEPCAQTLSGTIFEVFSTADEVFVILDIDPSERSTARHSLAPSLLPSVNHIRRSAIQNHPITTAVFWDGEEAISVLLQEGAIRNGLEQVDVGHHLEQFQLVGPTHTDLNLRRIANFIQRATQVKGEVVQLGGRLVKEGPRVKARTSWKLQTFSYQRLRATTCRFLNNTVKSSALAQKVILTRSTPKP